MILMNCPHCGKKLSIPEKYAGTSGTCNHCGGHIAVPSVAAKKEFGGYRTQAEKDAWVQAMVGAQFITERNFEAALTIAEQALAKSARCKEAWLVKGAALGLQNRRAEALSCYNKALQIDPYYDEAIIQREELCEQMTRDKACADAGQVCREVEGLFTRIKAMLGDAGDTGLGMTDAWWDKFNALNFRIKDVIDHRDVPFLVSALGDNKPFIRRRAACALSWIGDPCVIEPLIAGMLRDPDEMVRRDAADILERISGTRAVALLISALREDEEGVRCVAARKLGGIGALQAIEPLIGALSDVSPEVRRDAAEALGRIGDPRATEPIIGALHDDDLSVRCRAAEALGRVGDRRAVAPLIEVLALAALADEHFCSDVARALGRLGDPRAPEPLRALLNHPDLHLRIQVGVALKWLEEANLATSDS